MRLELRHDDIVLDGRGQGGWKEDRWRCQDAACLPASGWPAGYTRAVGCARTRKGEQAQNVKNKIASRIEEKGTLFPFRRQDPFLCFFPFSSFSFLFQTESSINRRTFASFCGVRGSPGVSKAALNSTVLVGGGGVQPNRPPDPPRTAIPGREGKGLD
ncbi:hypothetical protein B9Z19DRAFT_1164720 [Tuber borchii]|uniref:Uncharacterized protein n=1 Tax=Tuber borchii TaxID=42251 RepID=A0A2T7A1U9_TUBBO|nr:hypothetical protein B9Z19DRAFT_1164720 [Tuber borchii]